MNRPYLQYDVFTDQPLSGNQLAVFTDSQGLDLGTMQRIAREMNFPESTFILPVEWAGTDIRMRIFTPATEMPVAGHPTIGSTFALADVGVITPGTPRFVFHLNIGPTPVDLEWTAGRLSFAWMTQPNPVFGPVAENRVLVAEVLSLTPDDLLPDAPVQEVSCGVPFLYVPLRDSETVDRAVSDGAAFRRLAKSTGMELPIFVFAMDAGSAAPNPAYGRAGSASAVPNPAYRRAGSASAVPNPAYRRAGSALADPPLTVYSRMFAPEFGITEDPATGIASGPLGAYLVRHRLVNVGPPKGGHHADGPPKGGHHADGPPKGGRHAEGPPEGGHHEGEGRVDIVSRQGVAMGRPSRIHISIGIADGVINDVRVGGQAVLVARGEFLV